MALGAEVSAAAAAIATSAASPGKYTRSAASAATSGANYTSGGALASFVASPASPTHASVSREPE